LLPPDLEAVLPRATRPARYTDAEWNADRRPWEAAELHLLLAYPDVYEVGMACPVLHSLYCLLNGLPGVMCHRLFAPWPDLELLLREEGHGLWSLEGRRRPRDYDAVLLWMPAELCTAAAVNLLDLAGLPWSAGQREEGPLVLAAGPAVLNPWPLSEAVDAYLLGDPEAIAPEVVQALAGAPDRSGRLKGLARVPGVWVPALASGRPIARWADPLPPPAPRPVVPFVETAREGLEVELARGGGQAPCSPRPGPYWGPRRERPAPELLAAVLGALRATGYRDVFLTGAPYSQARQLALELRQALPPEVTVRFSRLPPEEEWVDLASLLAGGRPVGALTLWLGAASERLRMALGLPYTDAAVLAAAEAAYARGWTSLRFQLELGLPGEAEEDVASLVRLAQEARRAGRAHHSSRAHLRLEVSLFVPRPWTPFQWAAQPPTEALEASTASLRAAAKRTGVEVMGERAERALLAAVLARADRRLSPVARRAWELGARLDTHRESFAWAPWERALTEADLSPGYYAHRELGADEPLPWEALEVGAEREGLWAAWQSYRAALGLAQG